MIKLGMRRVGHSAQGVIGNVCKILVGTPKDKRPLGRPGHRWEENIKTGLGERVWVRFVWITIGTCGRFM
jgi:hypothetical protein